MQCNTSFKMDNMVIQHVPVIFLKSPHKHLTDGVSISHSVVLSSGPGTWHSSPAATNARPHQHVSPHGALTVQPRPGLALQVRPDDLLTLIVVG